MAGEDGELLPSTSQSAMMAQRGRMSFARVKHYYNRCKPEVPVPAEDRDNWYVDFDAADLRGQSCATRLLQTIQLADAPTTQLFTGFPGAGKTSELVRLRARLEADDYFVVLADSLETVDPNNSIEYTDVVIALGLAVDEALAKAGVGDGRTIAWTRRFAREVGELLSADITIQNFKSKSGVDPLSTDIGMEIRRNPSFRGVLREAANGRRRQLLDQVHAFFMVADRSVRSAGWTGGLVVILDNLEKLSGDPDVRSSAFAAFHHHVDALRTPPVHLIYTIPSALVFSRVGPQLGRLYTGEPLVLPMVRMWSRERESDESSGHAAMRELIARRVDIDEVFGSEAELLDRLVRCSGGYARDLLRLVQYTLQAAGELPVSAEHVSQAVDTLRLSYQRAFNTADLPLLQHVRARRPLVIPDEHMGRLEDVIAGHFVMVYANHRQWYDLHPLVAGLVDEVTAELATRGASSTP